ncbi:hypothetical protein CIHG_04960 [Coccidioides immitis H538.4]|uniref:Uncharacterized protein n=3 Tax=Coccidioides immitis TaxID=5501 RepID=A0A0J8R723_COCIT|nr:hypothetical protein CIRG_05469 [Coccidioides immitis RMSCC 2394]KMU80829.1 hypothetical protein CISG_08954 [Coccidioides immitis RMSCC 3703]KMU87020.1 hypothetical protein CIHG_04960 [Coccidioides immitis H538.4]
MALTDGRMEMILRCPRRRTISVSADGQESRVVSVKMLGCLLMVHPPGGRYRFVGYSLSIRVQGQEIGTIKVEFGTGEVAEFKDIKAQRKRNVRQRDGTTLGRNHARPLLAAVGRHGAMQGSRRGNPMDAYG